MFAQSKRRKAAIEIDLKWTYYRDYRKLGIIKREKTDQRRRRVLLILTIWQLALNLQLKSPRLNLNQMTNKANSISSC